MSVTAESLKHNKTQRVQVKKETRAILGYIDDEFRKAHDTGKTELTLTLPINFSITYMKNTVAQRKIYSKILSSLIERGFTPNLLLRKDATLITIRWWSDDEIKEMEIQNALIAKYSEKNYGDLNL